MSRNLPLRSLPILAVLLAACADDAVRQDAMETAEPALNPPSQAAPFDTSNTIRDIMASLIDPQADALWNAVRVVVDEDGIHEYAPDTDEDWEALRQSAIAIIEGSNALMMPGRAVAPPGAVTEFPEWEFTPAEVEAELAGDFQTWAGFAGSLQQQALVLKEAVTERDVPKLVEYGAYLDEVCDACHARYWYREGI